MRTCVVILCLTAAAVSAVAEEPAADSLRLYLPRKVEVTADALRVGTVAIVRGPAELVAKAEAVPLGRLTEPAQTLVIDRTTIVSRLTAEGIAPAGGVEFTGADEVAVAREATSLDAATLEAAAERALNSRHPAGPDANWVVVEAPEAVALPRGIKPKVQIAMPRRVSGSVVRIEMRVRGGETLYGRTHVVFRKQFTVRKAVARRALDEGTTLTRENVEIRHATSLTPQKSFQPPYGLLLTRDVTAGETIAPSMTRHEKPPLLVRRRQKVWMKVVSGSLKVSVLGEATEDGRVGETITLKNVASGKVVAATVMPDGTVRPMTPEGE